MTMIAALFVETNGVYCGLPDVDPWDAKRDARLYAGPYPVVAHPPCERWGRYWSGGPSARVRRQKGDDGGCFSAALAAVERYGGVLEHPEASHAWRAFGIVAPPRAGGWIRGLHRPGWTCNALPLIPRQAEYVTAAMDGVTRAAPVATARSICKEHCGERCA